MKLTLISTFILLTSSFSFANTKRNPASNMIPCSEVLKNKNIMVCTDLGPKKHCKDMPSRMLKKGQLWSDEIQDSAASELWTSNADHCLNFLTNIAGKEACCGG